MGQDYSFGERKFEKEARDYDRVLVHAKLRNCKDKQSAPKDKIR